MSSQISRTDNIYLNETISEYDSRSEAEVCFLGTTISGEVKTAGNIMAVNAIAMGALSAGGEISLDNTTCSKSIITESSLSVNASNVESIFACKDLVLKNSVCSGKAFSFRGIDASHSKAKVIESNEKVILSKCVVSEQVLSYSVTAYNCEQLGVVKAQTYTHFLPRNFVKIVNCPNVLSISGGKITLIESKVLGNVTSGGGEVTVKNSTIGKVLRCVTNYLVIESSEIDTLQMDAVVIEKPSTNFGSLIVGDVRMDGLSQYRSGGTTSFQVSGPIRLSAGHSEIRIGGSIGILHQGAEGNTIITGNQSLAKRPCIAAAAAPSESDEKQVLVLINSKVNNLIFKGGRGRVQMMGESTVRNIEGGSITV